MSQNISWILDIFFPKRCVGCGRIGSYLCLHCERTLIDPECKCAVCNTYAVDGITHPGCRGKKCIAGSLPLVAYSAIVRRFIHNVKYRNQFDAISDIIQCLIHRPNVKKRLSLVPDMYFQKGVIIPIPLHPHRYRTRGYNQAEYIARAISRSIQCSVASNVVVRIKDTPSQVQSETRHARLANMKGSFIVPKDKALFLSGKYIWLIDDVVTTGATTRSAAEALFACGVKGVWVVSVA